MNEQEQQAVIFQSETQHGNESVIDGSLDAFPGIISMTIDESGANIVFTPQNGDIQQNDLYSSIQALPASLNANQTDQKKKPMGKVYSDAIWQQMLLDEAKKEGEFDAEAEALKLQHFLEGNVMASRDDNLTQIDKVTTKIPKSEPAKVPKCVTSDLQRSSFELQSKTNPVAVDGVSLPYKCKKAPAVYTAPPKKKPSSERILMENQIRIRRQLKDELKYDLNQSIEATVSDKKEKGPNECTMCERKFVHPSGLVRHMEKHALDLIPTSVQTNQSGCQMVNGLRLVIKCSECGRVFYDIQVALAHIDTHYAIKTEMTQIESSNKRPIFKDYIAKAEKTLDTVYEFDEFDFVSASKVQEQKCMNILKTPILNSVLQCEYCEFVFADVSYMLIHAATHFPERPFECAACDVHMSTLKESINHYQTECSYMRENIKQLQVTLQRYYVCNICEEKFSTVEQFYEHRYNMFHYFPRENINKSSLVVPCEYCDATFTEAESLANHYEQRHLNKKKREKEPRSANITASGRIRQYLCEICGKSYTQSSHLWQHLRFHQGVKPFVCQENGCGRKFTIRPDLNDHIRKCHTGERPYHCLVCGKRFLTGSVFYQHRLIHRGERRYECEECGKRFYRADALKNHQRIHTGEKPYSCLFCTKTFRQRGDRDKHIRARHAHLDANSRLMMQMQKFKLEAAAALKAKNIQDNPESQIKPDANIIAEMFPQTMVPPENNTTFMDFTNVTEINPISFNQPMALEIISSPEIVVYTESPI